MKTAVRQSIPMILIALFIICTSLKSWSQEHPSQFWSKVRFGGGIGLSVGNGFFSGTISPSGIYQFNDQFAAGVGVSATYTSEKNVFRATVLGVSLLGLYNVLPEIQFSAEFEPYYVSRNFDAVLALEDDNYFYPALFLGAGYETGPVTIGMRYDILFREEDSIYANSFIPFIRVYF